MIRLRKRLAKEAIAEKEREIREEKKRLVEQRKRLVSGFGVTYAYISNNTCLMACLICICIIVCVRVI